MVVKKQEKNVLDTETCLINFKGRLTVRNRAVAVESSQGSLLQMFFPALLDSSFAEIIPFFRTFSELVMTQKVTVLLQVNQFL